jgi:hypothetical protein
MGAVKVASHEATTAVIPGLRRTCPAQNPESVLSGSKTDSGFRALRGPGMTSKKYQE